MVSVLRACVCVWWVGGWGGVGGELDKGDAAKKYTCMDGR